MKKITLLLVLLIGISATSQTVYRLYKLETFNYDEGWVLNGEETYQYGNEGTKETIRLKKNVVGDVYTDNFQHLKDYNENNFIIEDIKQIKSGDTWVNDTRQARMYVGGNNLTQRLNQIANGDAWENQSKTDYTYPDENTTIAKDYLYENDVWVQYTEDMLTKTATGWLQVSKVRSGGVLVNSDRTETIYTDGKLDEQISERWDELAMPQAWVKDSRYKVFYDMDGLTEKEEISDWNTTLMPPAWEVTAKILYARSDTNPKLIRTYQDCEIDPCENAQRTLTSYYPSGNTQTSTTEIWDPDLGVSGEWTDWSESNYEYDTNDNNTITTSKRIDFIMPENGLQFTTRSIKYWEEATSLSVTFNSLISVHPYPNPTTDFINIKFKSPLANTSDVKLFDIQGNLVHHAIIKNGNSTHKIPITYQSNGIYMLHLTSNNTKEVYKIIKNN